MSGKVPTKNEEGSIIECSVAGCRNGKKFHFPEEPGLRRQWLQAIRKENLIPNPHIHGLCAQHFTVNDFTGSPPHTIPGHYTTLRHGAVPSIFPWSNSTMTSKNLYGEDIADPRSKTFQNSESSAAGMQSVGNKSVTGKSDECKDADESCNKQEESMLIAKSLTSVSGNNNPNNCLPDTKIDHGDSSTKMPSNTLPKSHDNVQNENHHIHQSDAIPTASDEISKDDEMSGVGPDICDPGFSSVLDGYEEVIEPEHDITSDGGGIGEESFENTSSPQNDGNISPVETDEPSCTNGPKFDYDIENYKHMPKAILHLTGLENYGKFMLVLQTIGPAAYHMKYLKGPVTNINVPNQFFLVLRKLRRNECDSFLATHFKIEEIAVQNIFITWIICMYQHWTLIDLWPSRGLVDFYMPTSFRFDHPSTRVIIDSYEIPIERPPDQRSQKSSSSNDENESTVKVLFGFTPAGLIAYHSEAYEGSASNSEILEDCDLLKKCEPGDSIMVDEGFFGQDTRARNGVGRQGPTFIEELPPYAKIMRNRQLSKLNTFEILKSQLNHDYVPLVSEIFTVCVMLCNFKENTVVN